MKSISLIFVAIAIALSSSFASEIKQNRKVSPFTAIYASGALKIFITQGNDHKLRLEGEASDLELIKSEVKNGKLRIYKDKKGHHDMEEVRVYITFKDLESLQVSGASQVTSENVIKTKDFNFSLSGASKADLQVESSNFDADISGASKVSLSGKTNRHKISTSGAVKYNAVDFDAAVVHVDASGASKIDLAASKELVANSSGATKIKYIGSPEKVNVKSSGAGSVSKIN